MARGLEGVERLTAKFARMTPAARKAAAKVVHKVAHAKARKMKAIAPVDFDGDHPGRLRDSIHVEEGRFGDISAVVIADARDENGKPYAAPVDLGHTAEDGSQVPAVRFFGSVVIADKKKDKRAIASAISRAIRAEAKGGAR